MGVRGAERGALPARALPQRQQLCAERVHRGRPHDVDASTTCTDHCRVHHAAGGGVWRTKDIFASNVNWDYLGGPLGINSAGAISFDPNDVTRKTIYVGTGEANICGSGCVAGAGLYKSTDEGETLDEDRRRRVRRKGRRDRRQARRFEHHLRRHDHRASRLFVVLLLGVTRPVPGAAKWGLYKTTNGGASWSFIHNGSTNVADCTGLDSRVQQHGYLLAARCPQRRARPVDSNILYASSYARGIWRSNDAGATWTQIKPSQRGIIQTRASIDVNVLPNGKTRMYVYEGQQRWPVLSAVPERRRRHGRAGLHGPDRSDHGVAWLGDVQPVHGAVLVRHVRRDAEGPSRHRLRRRLVSVRRAIANKRGVILSTDAGVSGTDMTFDGTDPVQPHGLHPDQHDIAVHPQNPFIFVETNDGGVMRSNGKFVDRSSWCEGRPLSAASMAVSADAVAHPRASEGINGGLGTLQFQSLSVSPHNVKILQGGTQDNGTWEGKNCRRSGGTR